MPPVPPLQHVDPETHVAVQRLRAAMPDAIEGVSSHRDQVTVRIPAGTPSGKVLRVRGHGMNGGRDKAGDLLVTVDVQVPAKLNPEQRDALEALAAAVDEDPRAALFAAAQTQHRKDDDGT